MTGRTTGLTPISTDLSANGSKAGVSAIAVVIRREIIMVSDQIPAKLQKRGSTPVLLSLCTTTGVYTEKNYSATQFQAQIRKHNINAVSQRS